MSLEFGDKVTADEGGFIKKAKPGDPIIGEKIEEKRLFSGTVCNMKTKDGSWHIITISPTILIGTPTRGDAYINQLHPLVKHGKPITAYRGTDPICQFCNLIPIYSVYECTNENRVDLHEYKEPCTELEWALCPLRAPTEKIKMR